MAEETRKGKPRIVLQLDKALYRGQGCFTSMLLQHFEKWGMRATTMTTVCGKVNEESAQATVTLHVDDIKVSSTCEKMVLLTEEGLKNKYKAIISHNGEQREYPRMVFSYNKPNGTVCIKMNAIVNSILRDLGSSCGQLV
jgi:hypothetical protein